MTQDQPMPSAATGSGRVGLILLMGALGPATVGQLLPTIQDYAATMHLSGFAAGLLVSAPSAVPALLGAAVGVLGDRWSERRIIRVALVVLLAGNLLALASASYAVMLAARIVEGFAYLGLMVSGAALLMRATSGRRLVVATAAWGAMATLSLGVTTVLVSLTARPHWRTGFILLAAAAAFCLLLSPALPALPPSLRASGGRSLWSAVTQGRIWSLAAAFGIASALQTGISTRLVPFFVATFAMTVAGASTVVLAFLAVTTVATFAMAFLLNRGVSPIVLAAGGGLLTAAGGGFLFGTTDAVTAIVATFAAAAGTGMIGGVCMTRIPHLAADPGSIGVTTGFIIQLVLIGVLIGPPLFLSLASAGQGMTMILFVAASCVMVAAFGLAIRQLSSKD